MHSSLQNILDRVSEAELLDSMHNNTPVSDMERIMVREVLTNVAHYVVDQRILDLVSSTKVDKSMRALIKAGIRELPFDPMLIEMPDLANGRAFVRLQTHPMSKEYEAKNTDIYAYVYCTMETSERQFLILSFKPGVPLHIKWAPEEDETGFYVAVMQSKENDEFRAAEHIGMTAVAAMLVAMFMLNTRGVTMERVTHEKLNKHRAKKGRPRINDYTVIRVGHIYDSKGVAHDVNTTGRHMPVHWRSAHVRNVRYGSYKEEAKHRPVFIPACLVNYEHTEPDEFVPLPKKEVTV